MHGYVSNINHLTVKSRVRSGDASPLGGHALHGAPHQRVAVQHGVEVLHRQGEQVAVRLGAHAGHPAGVGQQTDLAEVGAVAERGGHLAVDGDVHYPLLDKVHLVADGALLDDDVT